MQKRKATMQGMFVFFCFLTNMFSLLLLPILLFHLPDLLCNLAACFVNTFSVSAIHLGQFQTVTLLFKFTGHHLRLITGSAKSGKDLLPDHLFHLSHRLSSYFIGFLFPFLFADSFHDNEFYLSSITFSPVNIK